MVKVALQTRQGVHEVDAPADERLLYCGLRQGYDLAHECASGTCGTCKAILISGDVRSLWSNAPGNQYVRQERNEFLMCQAVAQSDEVCIKVRPALKPPTQSPVPANLEGVIQSQELLTEDVAVFEYQLSRPVRFLAGQFITVARDEFPGYRAYSMTNYSADETQLLKFLVKRIPGGKLTEWLFEKDRTGCTLQGFGPLGRAVFVPDSDRDIVALAGGSGIAGIMAILAQTSSCGHFEQNRAQVVFGLNRPNDAFFLESLNRLGAEHPNLQIWIALVEPDSSGSLSKAFPALEFGTGYLHEVADQVLGDLTEVSTAFLAGPPVAVDASRKMLVETRKFSVRKIRFDRFG